MRAAGLAGVFVAVTTAAVVVRAGQAPAQEPPVFRADIDVVRLDVTVLDKDRRPVRGLTAEDFTVTEDGQSQRVIAVTEIQASENDPVLTPRMRYVPRDVVANDVVDRLGDGRVFALVLDDFNIPFDDDGIARSTREAARHVIDGLGPSDVASVIYTYEAGNTVDFTDDRAKLLAAIDRFKPPERYPGYTPPTPQGPGPWGGDMAQRWAPALMRSQCVRSQPLVPTLETVALRLGSIPNRRKTVVVLSTGMVLNVGSSSGCSGELAGIVRDTFRAASRGNINIYGVDPAGYRGYEEYLQSPLRNAQLGMRSLEPRAAGDRARQSREFLQTTAENTGGRAIVGTDAIERGLDEMFAEDGSYYLVGYQSSNSRADGKFRKVGVSVKQPGATARARSGYYSPLPGSLASDGGRTAAANELNLSGLGNPIGVALRAASAAVGLAEPGTSRDGIAAFTLSIRYPASAGTVSETLTITRNVYDADDSAGTPVQEKLPLTLAPAGIDGQRRELYYALRLAPGRHQVRFEVHSSAINRSSSVIAEVEVPDFSRARLALSGIVLGSTTAEDELPSALRGTLPIVPAAERDFAANTSLLAFVRVFQAGAQTPSAVTVKTEILDGRDHAVLQTSEVLPIDAFDTSRTATFQAPLNFASLERGPYVLSISAEAAGAPTVRRDVLFRIR